MYCIPEDGANLENEGGEGGGEGYWKEISPSEYESDEG